MLDNSPPQHSTLSARLGNISWHLTHPVAQTMNKSDILFLKTSRGFDVLIHSGSRPHGRLVKTNQAGRGTIVLFPRTVDASCPTVQGYDSGRISLLRVLLGHPSSNSWMATHCPVWSIDGTFTGFSIRLDIPSCLVQHTREGEVDHVFHLH